MVVEKNSTLSRAVHNPEKISREAPYSKYGGAPDKRKLVEKNSTLSRAIHNPEKICWVKPYSAHLCLYSPPFSRSRLTSLHHPNHFVLT